MTQQGLDAMPRFERVPKAAWQCGYVDVEFFTAMDVVPPLSPGSRAHRAQCARSRL
jgi:hypothetical protein